MGDGIMAVFGLRWREGRVRPPHPGEYGWRAGRRRRVKAGLRADRIQVTALGKKCREGEPAQRRGRHRVDAASSTNADHRGCRRISTRPPPSTPLFRGFWPASADANESVDRRMNGAGEAAALGVGACAHSIDGGEGDVNTLPGRHRNRLPERGGEKKTKPLTMP
jgi:hypothetical protein